MSDLPMPGNAVGEPVLKKDRALILTFVCVLMLIAWAHVLTGAAMGVSAFDMTVQSGELKRQLAEAVGWSPAYAVKSIMLWFALCVAIMLPSTSSSILTYAAFNRQHRDPVNPVAFPVLFTTGYLFVWLLFCIAISAVQSTFSGAGLMTEAMSIANLKIAGGMFVAAGLYQFTSVKDNSLKHVRHHERYLYKEWLTGASGALRMGYAHGVLSLTRGWPFIALLLAVGTLNVLIIAIITAYLMVEKFSGQGRVISIMAGAGLACWGAYLLAIAFQL